MLRALRQERCPHETIQHKDNDEYHQNASDGFVTNTMCARVLNERAETVRARDNFSTDNCLPSDSDADNRARENGGGGERSEIKKNAPESACSEDSRRIA